MSRYLSTQFVVALDEDLAQLGAGDELAFEATLGMPAAYTPTVIARSGNS